MSVPTSGETFSKLIHHIREAESACAMLAHLENNDRRGAFKAKLWLAASEQFRRMVATMTTIATGRLN